MCEKAPIFIVGAPRSGTTLLAAMLAAHSQISGGPETHFFRWLANTDPEKLFLHQNWPNEAVQFIASIRHTNFSEGERIPLIEKYQLNQQEIRDYLIKQPPSIQAILSSITEQSMNVKHKVRWVEKTPDHIMHVDLIRKYFPHSPIIRILRDPRDVALSLTKVPWGAETFIYALMNWKKIDLASDPFFQKDEASFSLRFEDLIENPATTLQKICQFLGEEFEENMLNTTDTGKQLNSRNVTWKSKASQPIDRSRIGVWKTELTAQQKNLAEALIGDRLQVHGYELFESLDQVGELFPRFELAPKYEFELESLPNQNVRFWKHHTNEKTDVTVYIGDPSCEHWFGGGRIGCFVEAGLLAFKIIYQRLSRKTIYWIQKEEQDSWTGYAAALVKPLLSKYKFVAAANIPSDQ